MLNLLRIARDVGTLVINDPVGLARASTEQFYEAPFIETCVSEVVAHIQESARSRHGE